MGYLPYQLVNVGFQPSTVSYPQQTQAFFVDRSSDDQVIPCSRAAFDGILDPLPMHLSSQFDEKRRSTMSQGGVKDG